MSKPWKSYYLALKREHPDAFEAAIVAAQSQSIEMEWYPESVYASAWERAMVVLVCDLLGVIRTEDEKAQDAYED